jgi:hypothetical protein
MWIRSRQKNQIMKNLKLLIVILIIFKCVCANAQVIKLKNQVFTHDTIIKARKIIFEKDASVRIKNAATVTFIADTVEVETSCLIDGRGENSANGPQLNPPTWTSGQLGHWTGGDERHTQWEKAGKDGNDIGTTGSPGTNGAKITIKYKVRGGISGSLAGLVWKTEGGKGGAGGPGRTLICGECGKTKIGDHQGATGANGKDGSYHLVQD